MTMKTSEEMFVERVREYVDGRTDRLSVTVGDLRWLVLGEGEKPLIPSGRGRKRQLTVDDIRERVLGAVRVASDLRADEWAMTTEIFRLAGGRKEQVLEILARLTEEGKLETRAGKLGGEGRYNSRWYRLVGSDRCQAPTGTDETDKNGMVDGRIDEF